MNLVTSPRCEREEAVAEALRLRRWDDALRAHARDCDICADVVMVASFLESQAAGAASTEPLPDADLIYWKAQLHLRREATERATRPIAVAERLGWFGGMVTVAAILAWAQPDLFGWVARIPELWSSAHAALPAALSGANLSVLAILSLLPVYLAFSVIHAARSSD